MAKALQTIERVWDVIEKGGDLHDDDTLCGRPARYTAGSAA
jgi:hypothetical protein